MRTRLLSLIAAGCFASQALAINPFSLIEDGYPEGKGVLELENTLDFDYHLGSDHSFKQYTVEHEFEYGYDENLTLRVAGSYYYEDSADNKGMHFDTFKLEGQYYFTNPNTDDVGLSVLGAVELGEHTLSFTGIGVIQKDWEKWTVAANLGVSVEIDGVFEKAGDTSTSGSIFGGIGATYSLTNTIRLGANASVEAAYDNLNDYAGTTVYVGPVLNWVPDEHWWVTFGPSYQLTNESDAPDWNFHLVVSYYF